MKQHQNIKRMATILLLLGLMLLTGSVWADEAVPQRPVMGTRAAVLSMGQAIDLAEAPLLCNGTVYLPLRSLLNTLSPQTTDIIWKEDRSITLKTAFTDARNRTVQATIRMAIDDAICNIATAKADTAEGELVYNVQLSNKLALAETPILKDSKTYIPLALLSALNREVALTEGVTVIMDSDEAMLQKAELARTWAEALKTRDGKPRYDMMTEALQSAFTAEHAEAIAQGAAPYSIGVSSPWTVAYDIHMQGNTAYITYYQTDSTGERTELGEEIVFTETDNGWKICESR